MKKLLQFELRRLLRFKAAIVCLIINFVYVLINAYLSNLDLFNLEDGVGTPALPLMLDGMDMIPMLVSIFAALYACNDYSNNTLKNIYSKGFERRDVYLSKMICLVAYCVAICLVGWIGSFLGGVIFCGVGSANGNFFLAILASLLAVIAYASICFMFATFFKKTGTGVAMSILGPMLIAIVLGLIDVIFIRNNIDFLLTEYWIPGYYERLTFYFPAFHSAKILTIAFIMSVVYAAGSTLLGLLIVKRQDI